MILHILPTVTHDFQRDYVMLVPAPQDVTPASQVQYLAQQGHKPAVVERDVVFAGITAFQRIYTDIVVHTVPL